MTFKRRNNERQYKEQIISDKHLPKVLKEALLLYCECPLSKISLIEHTGISYQTIYNMRTRKNPTLISLTTLLEALGYELCIKEITKKPIPFKEILYTPEEIHKARIVELTQQIQEAYGCKK